MLHRHRPFRLGRGAALRKNRWLSRAQTASRPRPVFRPPTRPDGCPSAPPPETVLRARHPPRTCIDDRDTSFPLPARILPASPAGAISLLSSIRADDSQTPVPASRNVTRWPRGRDTAMIRIETNAAAILLHRAHDPRWSLPNPQPAAAAHGNKRNQVPCTAWPPRPCRCHHLARMEGPDMDRPCGRPFAAVDSVTIAALPAPAA